MRLQRRVARVIRVSTALVVVLSFVGSPCLATPIDPRELTARKEYAAGRYSQSVEIFAELFAETGDPVFLRNIARSYQKMERPDEAISNFKEYLAKGKVSYQERSEIDSYIREMEALKRQRAVTAIAASPPAASPVVPGLPPSASAPAGPAAVTTFETSSRRNDARSDGGQRADAMRSWRIAGLTTATVGAVLLGTGVGFGVATRAASAGNSAPNQFSGSRESDGRRYEKLQWISYGVGAAALVTGGFLYLHGSGREERSTGVHVAAAPWPPTLGMEARF